MSDGIKVKGSIDPTAIEIHADEVVYDGNAGLVQRFKTGFGSPGAYVDVDGTHPLPVSADSVAAEIAALITALTGSGVALNTATLAALEQIQAVVSGTVALDAPTLAALEQITVNNPTDVSTLATQTTLANVLAALQAGIGTTPSTAGDVAGTLADGRKTVPTPGVAVALGAATPCRWVLVTALRTNTDQVNVGGATVAAALGSSTGQPLAPGDSVSVPVNNLNKVFVDARVGGEGVSYTVGS